MKLIIDICKGAYNSVVDGHLDQCIEYFTEAIKNGIPLDETMNAEQKHCKDCKWWRDSDGVYRRGIGAESQCPMNRRKVLEGTGYCYMFEPQESEG